MATETLALDAIMRWRHDVDVFEQAISHVNWDTIVTDSASLLNGMKRCTAQNSELNFDVPLAAGTWLVELLFYGSGASGICTIQFDGVTKGSVDFYRSSGTYNLRQSVSGIAVNTSGKVRLKLLMATKSASSSGYQGDIVHIQLRRTDAGGSSANYSIDPDTQMPWHDDINVLMTPISHVGYNNRDVSTSMIRNGYAYNGGAQNDEWNADVVLASGTWTFEMMHMTANSQGIFSVQLDGVEKGTIDGYSATQTFNVRSSITGISVATTGKYRLKLKMATKNASSSSYNGYFQHLQLRRTA